MEHKNTLTFRGGLISFFVHTFLNTFKIEVGGSTGWLVKFKIAVNKKKVWHTGLLSIIFVHCV